MGASGVVSGGISGLDSGLFSLVSGFSAILIYFIVSLSNIHGWEVVTLPFLYIISAEYTHSPLFWAISNSSAYSF